MRIYLPATSETLRALLAASLLGPAPMTGFAVTAGLREWYDNDDEEELEYAALTEAARASLRLLDATVTASRCRVVIAVDVPDADVTARDDLDRGVVSIGVTVPLAAVASVHTDDVGDAAARDTVRAAARAIVAADLGDATAQDAVDDAEGFELCWYANQEIPALLAELTAD